MKDFLVSCVEKYLELTKQTKTQLKRASTPFIEIKPELLYEEIEEAEKASGNASQGTLQPIASRILMKVLYAARMMRFDLLKIISLLASKVTKWTPVCDRLLHRMVCYVNDTTELKLYSWVGDAATAVHLRLSADADLASDQPSMRSTSGTYLALFGPNTKAPLNGRFKRQTAVSHSTPEAEIAAADEALRTEGIPATELWNTVLKRQVQLRLQEDNDACRTIIVSGKNPNIRYMNRTHKINIAWIHECHESGVFMLDRCPSDEMEADIMTKPITKPDYWVKARSNININYSNELKWDNPRPAAAPCKVPTAVSTGMDNRVVIEFCCGEDSRLGRETEHSRNCIVYRLTEAHDLTTAEGLKFAKQCVDKSLAFNGKVLLWISIPCTGGSPWQQINKKYPSARLKIRNHIKLFNKLWSALVELTDYMKHVKLDYVIGFEWPKDCSYWRLRKVKKFESDHKLKTVLVNGCRVNLRSIVNDKLIPKPWFVKTDSDSLNSELQGRICNHTADMHTHCAGKDTKRSEEYTDEFVALIHDGFRKHCEAVPTNQPSFSGQNRSRLVTVALPAIVKTVAKMASSSNSAITKAEGNLSQGWTDFIQRIFKSSIRLLFPELNDKLGGAVIAGSEIGKILTKKYSEEPGKFGQCGIVQVASTITDKSNDFFRDAPEPPSKKNTSITGIKGIVLGDSFVCMTRIVKSDRPSCEWELQERTGNLSLKVRGERGATLTQLIPILRTALQEGNKYIVFCWMCNDLFAKESKKSATKVVAELPPNLLSQVDEVCGILKQFQGHLMLVGGNASTWGVDDLFDQHCNRIFTRLKQHRMVFNDGLTLARRLECRADDLWHSIRTKDNAECQAHYFESCFEYLRLIRPDLEYQAMFDNYGVKWISGTDAIPRSPPTGPSKVNKASGSTAQSKASGNSIPVSPPMPKAFTRQAEPARPKPEAVSTVTESKGMRGNISETIPGSKTIFAPNFSPFWKESWPNERRFGGKMSALLRHPVQWQKSKMLMGSDGFADIDRFMELLRHTFPEANIEMIAAEVGRNDKQRHQFWIDNQNKIRGIRAVQGHDANVVEVDKVMVKIGTFKKPEHLTHLTFRESIDGIIKSGLIPGGGRKNRGMCHFSPFRYGDPRVLSGARFNAPIETIWDVDAILQNKNISLYWTDSHAVCSNETIPSSYLIKAINVHTGFVIYDRAAVMDREAKKALGNEEQARQQKQRQEMKEERRTAASSSSSIPYKEEAKGEDSPRPSEEAEETKPETTGEQDQDNAESFEDGVDFDISEAEDPGQNDEERCSECTAIVSPGVLRCLECGHELHQQPPDAEDNSKQLADISKEMKESFDAVVNHIEKLKRNPYPSRAARLKRAIKDYDKKAKKGKKNQSGQVIKYSCYEERYEKDEAFRINMMSCRPPRDLTFRSLASSLEVQFKPKSSWQRGLIENERHKRSREEGGSESTGEAKGRGKGWQSNRPAQQWTGAGWWTATATWWTQGKGAYGYSTEVAVKADGNVVQFFVPSVNTFKWLFVMFAIVICFVIIYKCINALVRNCKNFIKCFSKDPRYQKRSVGVQSQCHYNLQSNRFQAYENGFRHSGEVCIQLHEYWPERNDKED